MRLIQYVNAQRQPAVGQVTADGAHVRTVTKFDSVRSLSLHAIATAASLAQVVEANVTRKEEDYLDLLAQGRVLPPLTHPDAAHCLVAGTGLTHLGSAAARDKMHQQMQKEESALTDSMKMFKWGMEGGKAQGSQPGIAPEWFYKGDGSIVASPESDLSMPDFALDGGEETEIAGLYVISNDGKPYRVGYALGNEFSDHVLERQNYLYLAHSKLRPCSIGPELLLGELPSHVEGLTRIVRGNKTIWKKEFLSGEDNMCHTIANLEYHHFKYAQFLHPGDIHVHFFGAATLSCADGITVEPGDRFEIEAALFGQPLRNTLRQVKSTIRFKEVRAL
jgi:hypothetical protein